NVDKLRSKIVATLDEEVPKKVAETKDQILKDNLRWIVREEIQKETHSTTTELSSRISQETVATAPQQFEAFFNNYIKTHVITLQPPSSTTILVLQKQLYIKMKDDPQSQAVDHNI
ncbi:hypothetical protein Tco_1297649, partial [Tanacetum coccineum]